MTPDCPRSLATDGDHCLHWFDEESCCWCEDECDCHDEDYGAAGVRGVHVDDDAMATARVRA